MRERRSSRITSSLGRDLLLGQAQVRHAIGFHVHHGAEPLLGDALVIGGDVVAGERVVLAAEARNDLGEFADRDLVGRLEHQMLEEVRDAGDAFRLIGRSDLVPDHVRDDGRAVVGDHDHLHAVGERELCRSGLGVCGGEGG